ncbi:transposase [Methanosarcinales archaeon]|nr:MAG: transposase [Methanosarcinales archaeon]
MMVKRTEQIRLESSILLSFLCHISKNLWNEADYIIRQEFFETGKWTRYNSLAGVLKTSENFRSLPAQTAQQVLKILDRSWKSFFRSIKEYSKNPEKFLGRPKLPGYKDKDGEFMLVFTNQQVKIVNGYLSFPKKLGIKIKTRLGDDTNIREVRIIPKGTGYVCEIVYEKDVESLNLNPDNVVGIDLGSANIIAMVNNIGEQPIIIKDDGRGIKSINQFYHKRKAEIQSIYDLQGIKDGDKLRRLKTKRAKKVHDYCHKVSRFIVDWCIKHNVGTIVFGYNEGWKQRINLGRRTNQTFTQIPFMNIIHKTTYKAEEVGINVVEQEESHTSKCSFLDDESVEHHGEYVGKRFKRGLFRSAKGIIINSDVNGGYNIAKKAIPKAFGKLDARRIGGCGLHPLRCIIGCITRRGLEHVF